MPTHFVRPFAPGLHIWALAVLAALSVTTPSFGQTVSANPNKLTFSYTPGGALPANQTVNLSAAGAPVPYVVRVVAPADTWLAVNPARGTTPAIFNVSVTPASLAPGTYQGTISLTPNGVVLAGIGAPEDAVVAGPEVQRARSLRIDGQRTGTTTDRQRGTHSAPANAPVSTAENLVAIGREEIGLDARMLAFALGITILATAICGLAPAAVWSRIDSVRRSRRRTLAQAQAEGRIVSGTCCLSRKSRLR